MLSCMRVVKEPMERENTEERGKRKLTSDHEFVRRPACDYSERGEDGDDGEEPRITMLRQVTLQYVKLAKDK